MLRKRNRLVAFRARGVPEVLGIARNGRLRRAPRRVLRLRTHWRAFQAKETLLASPGYKRLHDRVEQDSAGSQSRHDTLINGLVAGNLEHCKRRNGETESRGRDAEGGAAALLDAAKNRPKSGNRGIRGLPRGFPRFCA